MREKIRLIIIISLGVMLAVSIFTGLQTYSAKRALELERNNWIDENAKLAKKVEEAIRERKELQDKVSALSADLDKASQEKQDFQKQYELIIKERSDLLEKVKTLQRNNEQLRGDLSNLQREKQRLGQSSESNLAPIRQENAQLKQQLDNLNSLKTKLETELGQLKGEKSVLDQKLNEIDSLLEQKLTRLRYLSIKEELDAIRGNGTLEAPATQPAQSEKDSVELPPIVVKPQTQAKPDSPAWQRKAANVRPTGTVLEINKENKFIIIDLGNNVGTKLGDTFKVYKQGAPIANIEVIQVRQSISACDIKEEITPVEAGDIVR